LLTLIIREKGLLIYRYAIRKLRIKRKLNENKEDKDFLFN